MKYINIIFILAANFLLILRGNADLPGQWPELDKPPPYVDGFNGLVDFTKVPNAPVKNSSDDCGNANAGDPFCDWSCTTCTRDGDVVECPTKGDWGLTFDDGPTGYTDTLLDYLASQNIRATFFVVGSRVYENPDILAKAVKAGHQIGVHTWSHTSLTTQTNEAIVAEMQWTAAAIKAAVGLTPTYMRPPYGDFDDRVRNIVSQLGYKPTIWDKDTNDWLSDGDPSFKLSWIEDNFTQWVKEPSTTGHISLEHDLYKQTAERAPIVVPIVTGAGFNIKQVAVCRGDQPYLEQVSLNSSIAPKTPGDNPNSTISNPDSSNPTSSDSSLFTTSSSHSSHSTSNSSSNASNMIKILPLALIIISLINSGVCGWVGFGN